jgi:hypothetical protein
LTNGSREHPAVQVRMKFSKKEIDEIKDVLEDSLKYYKDLLDVSTSDPETKKMNIKYARAKIEDIESIKKELK